jgi:hypothetical protein
MALRSSDHRLGYGRDSEMNVVVDYGQSQDICFVFSFSLFKVLSPYGFDDMSLHNWITDKRIKDVMTKSTTSAEMVTVKPRHSPAEHSS